MTEAEMHYGLLPTSQPGIAVRWRSELATEIENLMFPLDEAFFAPTFSLNETRNDVTVHLQCATAETIRCETKTLTLTYTPSGAPPQVLQYQIDVAVNLRVQADIVANARQAWSFGGALEHLLGSLPQPLQSESAEGTGWVVRVQQTGRPTWVAFRASLPYRDDPRYGLYLRGERFRSPWLISTWVSMNRTFGVSLSRFAYRNELIGEGTFWNGGSELALRGLTTYMATDTLDTPYANLTLRR